MNQPPGSENYGMAAKVVDASIVAAWCFREARAADAAALLKDYEWHAPSLLAYELTSIARRKSIAYPKQAEAIREALRTVFAIPIHWNEVDHLDALRLALDASITTYDASYLYLSRKLGIPLATFDERLAQAASAG